MAEEEGWRMEERDDGKMDEIKQRVQSAVCSPRQAQRDRRYKGWITRREKMRRMDKLRGTCRAMTHRNTRIGISLVWALQSVSCRARLLWVGCCGGCMGLQVRPCSMAFVTDASSGGRGSSRQHSRLGKSRIHDGLSCLSGGWTMMGLIGGYVSVLVRMTPAC